MKIYLNVHETDTSRFEGIGKLTETDKLTVLCRSNSNFSFRLDEVKAMLNANCCLSIIDSENIEETLEILVEKSKRINEEYMILNDITSNKSLADIL